VNDLEILHKNVPSIQDFSLNCVKALPYSMPSNIIPATSITKLRFFFHDFDDKDSYIQLYQYATKKYTNITDINYKGNSPGAYFDEVNIRRDVYLNGILGFLEIIGRNLSEIDLYGLPDNVDPFKVLDSVDSRIKTTKVNTCDGETIFNYLAQSNQCRYVQELNIHDTCIESILPINA
jgi:hypothetical protein